MAAVFECDKCHEVIGDGERIVERITTVYYGQPPALERRAAEIKHFHTVCAGQELPPDGTYPPQPPTPEDF